MNNATRSELLDVSRYRVTGVNCPSCAAKNEKAVRSVGENDVRVVAAVIAGLFLHSSWVIIRDAQSDLREAS